MAPQAEETAGPELGRQRQLQLRCLAPRGELCREIPGKDGRLRHAVHHSGMGRQRAISTGRLAPARRAAEGGALQQRAHLRHTQEGEQSHHPRSSAPWQCSSSRLRLHQRYINMSTADATRRAKEVALRKVSGAQRGQLVAQFIGGSVMIAVIGIFVALGLLWLALAAFNGITEEDRHGLPAARRLRGGRAAHHRRDEVAGSYPAFFLSRFAPPVLLKEGVASGAGRNRVRKVLMGVQFAIALFMVVGTLGGVRAIALAAQLRHGLYQGGSASASPCFIFASRQDTLAWDALRAFEAGTDARELRHRSCVHAEPAR